ncbi:putative adhesin [Actinomyces dentalis]|uniref:putative adhesin n=1 Tax=Actinomyces dentalis TaxID=272548 RepID=UPI0036F40864
MRLHDGSGPPHRGGTRRQCPRRRPGRRTHGRGHLRYWTRAGARHLQCHRTQCHGRPDNSLRAWRNLGGRYYDVHPSEGVNIRFYTPLGARMYDPEANAVEAGSRRWPFIGAHSHPYEVASPDGTIPDHVLHPPDSRITITGNPVTAARPARLSAPVGMYEVRTYDWAACREVVPPKSTP